MLGRGPSASHGGDGGVRAKDPSEGLVQVAGSSEG